VHHLAADLPVGEVSALAGNVSAGMVVLSSAAAASARLAGELAEEMQRSMPGVHVLAGRPGDTLSQLRRLAQAAMARPA
jgi:hypothetical protein